MGKPTGRRCTICSHPEKWRIELLKAGGASTAAVADKFGVSEHALYRHWHAHVTPEAKAGYLAGPSNMAKLQERAAAEGESVLDYLRMTRTTLMSALAACSEAGDARGVAIVSNSLVAVLDKLGRITGELAQIAGSVNVNIALINSPEFAQAQAAILRALAPFGDARMAVVAALRALDAAPLPPIVDVTPEPARTLPPPPPWPPVPT